VSVDCQIFIEKDANINHQDNDARTGLHWVAERGNTPLDRNHRVEDIIRLLLSNMSGPAIAAKDVNGHTVYDIAAKTYLERKKTLANFDQKPVEAGRRIWRLFLSPCEVSRVRANELIETRIDAMVDAGRLSDAERAYLPAISSSEPYGDAGKILLRQFREYYEYLRELKKGERV
jgi:hypothetical protein